MARGHGAFIGDPNARSDPHTPTPPPTLYSRAQGNPAAVTLFSNAPRPDEFPPELHELLLAVTHPEQSQRPTAREVLAHPWLHEECPGVPLPLCCCWELSNKAPSAAVAPADHRLMTRAVPPLRELSLAHSPCVTDEWLEALATHHGGTLTKLDLSGCVGLTRTTRPLAAISKMVHLELLRLPSERWHSHDVADAIASLPKLRAVDPSTHADLTREREALNAQCVILRNAAE